MLWLKGRGMAGIFQHRVTDALSAALRLSFLPLTMALRRWAQTNNANVNGSPRVKSPNSPGMNSQSVPGTPGSAPSSPRPRASYMYSPSATPSISSSVPFDWDALRSMKPAPYGSPGVAKRRMATKATATPTRKGVTRKKGLIERYVVSYQHAITYLLATQNTKHTLANSL